MVAAIGYTDLDSLVFTQSGPKEDHQQQIKTTTEVPVSVGPIEAIYVFLRLAIPSNPSRPELNSHIAAGTRTAETSRTKATDMSG